MIGAIISLSAFRRFGIVKRMKTTSILLLFSGLFVAVGARAQSPVSTTVTNIAYYADASGDDYKNSQCRLDVRYPTAVTGFPTVIWFHGGGLTGGRRGFVDIEEKSIAVVSVSYRLSPKAEHPAYLEDAAAATAWVFANIAAYGGDTNKIFISGHSAGGWLAAMVGMDPRWLAPHGISNRALAGIAPVSAQVTAHFHVKKLLGDTGPQYRPLIDEWAPLYHCAPDLPPVCLITGDRNIEFPCRVEENELLAVSLRAVEHPRVEFYEMGGLDHVTVVQGGRILIRKFVKSIAAPKK